VLLFITAVHITKLFTWGEVGWRKCATRDDEPKTVWKSRTSERGGEGDCVKEGGVCV
jgi:hypothetical protein